MQLLTTKELKRSLHAYFQFTHLRPKAEEIRFNTKDFTMDSKYMFTFKVATAFCLVIVNKISSWVSPITGQE